MRVIAEARILGVCTACGLCLFGCASGGIQEHRSSASTAIASTELVSAEISFDDSGRRSEEPEEYAKHPPGFYQLSLKKSTQGAEYSAICKQGSPDGEKIIDLQFTADTAALVSLEQLIREKNVAAVNGMSRVGTAVKGTTEFDAVYASGEEIHASAEGGAELPTDSFQTDWFVDWFRSTAEAAGKEFCNPLIMYVDPAASRNLPDADIVLFDLSCRHSLAEEPDSAWQAGYYSMRMGSIDGSLQCVLGYQPEGAERMSFRSVSVSESSMAALKALLQERQTAMLNGYRRIEDTSLTQLRLQIDFADGRCITANAQGLSSAVKPYIYYEDSWYLDFFRHLAAADSADGAGGTGFPENS